MASPYFSLLGDQGAAIRTAVGKVVSFSPLYEQTYGKWMAPRYVTAVKGEATPVGGMKIDKWTDAPIETRSAEFVNGGTEMFIPVRKHLTGTPVFAGTPLFGRGKVSDIMNRRVAIGETRFSYALPTGLELQKIRGWKKYFVDNVTEELRYHYAGWTGVNVKLASFTGYSADLNQAANIGGLAEAYASHPNFYVAGQANQVGCDATGAYIAGNEPYKVGYEAAVATAIDTLAIGAAGTGMGGEFVKKMNFVAQRHRVPQLITKAGFKFRAMWVKDSAYNQLWSDPKFYDIAKRVNDTALAETPLGNCEGAYYMGMAIYPDDTMFAAYTAVNNGGDTSIASGVQYGARPTAAQVTEGWKLNAVLDVLDSGDIAMGIVVGASALIMGTGQDLQITEDEQDHGKKKEVGYDVIQSIVRGDVFDSLGTVTGTQGAFVENTSSVAFATKSPFAIE
jgi:hypothetical protein